jgi:hypothetical protein
MKKKQIQHGLLFSIIFLLSISKLSAQKVGQASGSGIALTTNGFIATNYHVVEGATKIEVDVFNGANKTTYKAEVVKSDVDNDLSIIKISDQKFKSFATIPFALKMSVNVAENVFAMGYPQIGIQGTEVKVTDGIISSKTGFKNDNKTYQISAAIQPGNSGGPLFDNSGNLIGLTNSGIPSAENVGYAIKSSYLNNLLDQITNFPGIPDKNTISTLPLPSKIKILSQFVVLIRVEVPICDKDIPSEQMKKINPSYTLQDINNLFGKKGEKNSETLDITMYKWQFCGNDVLNSIMVSFFDNRVLSVNKSFSNSTYSNASPAEIEKKLTVNLNYGQVENIFGTYGDIKNITFNDYNSTTVMCEWKLRNKECYYVSFFNGVVLTHTKSKCVVTN